MNSPEDYRNTELEANRVAAELAEAMMRNPRIRWATMPIYRLMKWVAVQARRGRQEDGWM